MPAGQKSTQTHQRRRRGYTRAEFFFKISEKGQEFFSTNRLRLRCHSPRTQSHCPYLRDLLAVDTAPRHIRAACTRWDPRSTTQAFLFVCKKNHPNTHNKSNSSEGKRNSFKNIRLFLSLSPSLSVSLPLSLSLSLPLSHITCTNMETTLQIIFLHILFFFQRLSQVEERL